MANQTKQNLPQTLHVAAAFSWRIEDRVFFTFVLENNFNCGLDTNSGMHKYWSCGPFLVELKVYSTWKDCATKDKKWWLSSGTSSNQIRKETFDSTTRIMTLNKTRDMLFSSFWPRYSIWYHLCDCPRLNWLDNIGSREGNRICIVDQLIVFFAWYCFMRHSFQGCHGVVAKVVIKLPTDN